MLTSKSQNIWVKIWNFSWKHIWFVQNILSIYFQILTIFVSDWQIIIGHLSTLLLHTRWFFFRQNINFINSIRLRFFLNGQMLLQDCLNGPNDRIFHGKRQKVFFAKGIRTLDPQRLRSPDTDCDDNWLILATFFSFFESWHNVSRCSQLL